jgi:DNA mismatch endonuclease (patch repair protein)
LAWKDEGGAAMSDMFTPERRSEIMGRIRSNDTKPEMTVRRALHRAGYRYRLHRRSLPGKPDLVLPRFKTVVFVHGCFWHGHTCKDGRRPKSHTDYWEHKLDRNLQRDVRAREELVKLGWKPIVIWACEVKDIGTLLSRVRVCLDQ